MAVSRSKKTYKWAEFFAQHVDSSCGSDKFEGFEVINRVVNPEGANGWVIVKTIQSQSNLKMVQTLCEGVGNDVEVIPVLTYD